MRWYKADLHIHTVLSPCGGLDMSPVNIIKNAVSKNLDIIGITDHNSTKHCKSALKIGHRYGITVLAGVEINTKEEIHCLAYFENMHSVNEFQEYIDANLPGIPNKPDLFGNQFVVDEQENILMEEKNLLLVALNAGINEIERKVHSLDGIFIPAHVNRAQNGLFNQLGFIPAGLETEALEVSGKAGCFSNAENPEINGHTIITGSDAHSLERIGSAITEFYLGKPLFAAIKNALILKNVRLA